MVCHVVYVTTDVGDARDIVGDIGTICETANPECIADAWYSLLQRGQNARQELRMKSRQRILDNFPTPKVVWPK